MIKNEWPCKCGHVTHHAVGNPKYYKCKCVWYVPMTNLEYLEWKNETQQHLLKR